MQRAQPQSFRSLFGSFQLLLLRFPSKPVLFLFPLGFFFLPAFLFLLLLVSGMPLFDSLCISFGSAGTGGFGVKNSSCADYSMLEQGII